MNTEQTRFNMIEQQIRPWDVLDQDVLDLLFVVKRENFVPTAYKALAFADTEIPLANGESMLTPKLEARILQEVGLKKHEHVLEIGAGSGYMAALLAYKGRHVTTVEIDPTLHAMAIKNLSNYGVANVEVALGNGAHGWNSTGNNRYDVIVLSGSVPVLPDAFLQQLNISGRLFAIVGEAPVMTAQLITRVSETTFDTLDVFETVVKPLRDAVVPSHFSF
jgi:protein-L-isoaspartate(D-aspartate) O-methyltransferase